MTMMFCFFAKKKTRIFFIQKVRENHEVYKYQNRLVLVFEDMAGPSDLTSSPQGSHLHEIILVTDGQLCLSLV